MLFVTAVGGYREPVWAAFGAACFGIAESLWSGYFPIEWRDAWMFAVSGRPPGAASVGAAVVKSSLALVQDLQLWSHDTRRKRGF